MSAVGSRGSQSAKLGLASFHDSYILPLLSSVNKSAGAQTRR
jgi:hypothetical protein